jgi:hypothetical protein
MSFTTLRAVGTCSVPGLTQRAGQDTPGTFCGHSPVEPPWEAVRPGISGLEGLTDQIMSL